MINKSALSMPLGISTSAYRFHYGWIWFMVFLLGYAFLYDNSTSYPNTLGYGWTQLTELPREMRFAEMLVIVGCLLFITYSKLSRISVRLLIGCSLFIFIATLSYTVTLKVPILDFARLCYMYVLPVFVFTIGREAQISSTSRETIAKLILSWVLINVVISWFQFIWLGYPVGDDITGLNKDAHSNGNLMFYAGLLLTSIGLSFKQRRNIILAILLLVTFILTSVLKTMFLGLLAFGLLIAKYGYFDRLRAKLITKELAFGALVFVLMIAIGYTAFRNTDIPNYDRMGTILTEGGLENIGLIGAHKEAVQLSFESPTSLLIGYGPFSAGNPISVGQTLAQGALSRYARQAYLAQSGDHGESARVTLSISLLLEFGPLAMIVLGMTYILLFQDLWRSTRSRNRRNRAYAIGLSGCLLIFLLTSIVSLFGTFDIISLSWPVMLLAGMTCRIEAIDSRS